MAIDKAGRISFAAVDQNDDQDDGIPKEPLVIPGSKRKRGVTAGQGQSYESRVADDYASAAAAAINPEEGWDDQTEGQCAVRGYPNRREVKQREAW